MNQDHATDGIIFFDDVCVLCNRTISLLLKIDRSQKFKFSSLTGRFAQEALKRPVDRPLKTVIFLKCGKIYERADAVIEILTSLGGVFRLAASLLRVIPRPICNSAYDLIARHRYRVFGRLDVCLLPAANQRDRFIS